MLYANIATFGEHVDPVQLGVSYYLAAINVQLMLVVHTLIFVYSLTVARNGLHRERLKQIFEPRRI